jgi:Ca2+/H+ antiporter, TMEM165/GDT1 family
MDLVVVALAFGAIFVVELPDKTFIATLVLSTRFRPLLVWIGVGLAFAVQTLVAVALGKAAALLPDDLVQVARPLCSWSER